MEFQGLQQSAVILLWAIYHEDQHPWVFIINVDHGGHILLDYRDFVSYGCVHGSSIVLCSISLLPSICPLAGDI